MTLIVAWTPAVLCALWALTRTSGIGGHFPLVPLLAYTPFVFPVAVLATLVAAGLREWLAAALAASAALLLCLALAPRVLGGEYEGPASERVRVMSANVLAGNADAEELVRVVRDRGVDVLALQEMTPKFVAELDEAGMERELPYSAEAAVAGVRGSAIYARVPIRPLSSGDEVFEQMRAELTLRGQRLDVTSVHPRPPTGWRETSQWRRGIDALPEPAGDGKVQLLLGDFNGTLDNPEVRELIDAGYADAAEEVGQGLVPTWPATETPFQFLPVTIDHLLIEDGELRVGEFDVLDVDGSDHRPVYAELVKPAGSSD